MHWLKHIQCDFIVLWWLKATGTALAMVLFFQVYFYLLHQPARTVFIMPSTAIDQAISFSAPWVLAYFSLWVYVSLPGALQCNGRNLFWHAMGFFALCLTGLLFYYFFPTTLEQPAIDWSTMPVGKILQTLDQTGNVFPSMHVASAQFACLWLRRELRRIQTPHWLHVINIVWCGTIVYSTLATKQHVVLDVVAGLALGTAAGWASVRLADSCQRKAINSGQPRA